MKPGAKISMILAFLLITGIISYGGGNNLQVKGRSQKDTIRIIQDDADLLAGIARAICYSGFRDGQHPDRGQGAVNPSYSEVLEDLQILSNDAGFKLLRLYDCSENSEMVLNVIRDHQIKMKVMLGIWLKAELSNHEGCAWLDEPIPDEVLKLNKSQNLDEINRGISLANEYKDIVVAVNVGNEALVDWNDHKVETETVIHYVGQVSKAVQQPVSVAENYKWWAEQGAELASVVDFIAIHIYPIWEGKSVSEGLSYAIDNIWEVREAIPDKPIVISETGWATIASEFGDIASEDNQLKYYDQMMTLASEYNITTFFFEAFDENWKGDPNNKEGAEKHWGIYDAQRRPKKASRKK